MPREGKHYSLPMNPQIYSVIHVVSVILLTAFTFKAFANPAPEKRGKTMMLTGIFALLALVAGFGLSAKLEYGFPGWMIAKLGCWLLLSGLAGVAFRRPGATGMLTTLAVLIVGAAVYLVYFKPF